MQGRLNRPPNPPAGGVLGLVRGPALNTATFFYLEMILIRVTTQHQFVCVRACRKGRIRGKGEEGVEECWNAIAPLLFEV